jgi:hypothetical protein
MGDLFSYNSVFRGWGCGREGLEIFWPNFSHEVPPLEKSRGREACSQISIKYTNASRDGKDLFVFHKMLRILYMLVMYGCLLLIFFFKYSIW